MLEIINTQVYGLNRALNVAGYPMRVGQPEITYATDILEEQDTKRGVSLGNSPTGSGHDNYLSGIIVQCDIKYSLYWLKEWQRYHFQQINSSQSTMHSLSKIKLQDMCNKYVLPLVVEELQYCIERYNYTIEHNLETLEILLRNSSGESYKKIFSRYELFMTIVSNLPSGIEMWMGITTNYLQLKTMYHQRKNHKLKEDWGYFCNWCEQLPHFKEFCLKNKKGENK